MYLKSLLFSIVDCCWMQFFCCEIFSVCGLKEERDEEISRRHFKGVLVVKRFVDDVTR